MSDAHQPQILSKLPGEISRPIVGQQYRPVLNWHIGHTCEVHRLLHHINQRSRCHVRFEFPRQDKAAVIVHHCHQVVPAPVYHLQMSTIRGPELIRLLCLPTILLTSSKAHYLCRFDQPLTLQNAVGRALRDVPTPGINHPDSQLPGTQFRQCPGLSQNQGLFLWPQLIPGRS